MAMMEKRCKAVQHGDLMVCGCGLRWDTGDPEPPDLEAHIRADERRRCIGILACADPDTLIVMDGDGWGGPLRVFDEEALAKLFEPRAPGLMDRAWLLVLVWGVVIACGILAWWRH